MANVSRRSGEVGTLKSVGVLLRFNPRYTYDLCTPQSVTSGNTLHRVTPVASDRCLPWTPDKSIDRVRCYNPCRISVWLSAAPFAYHGSGIITRCGRRLPDLWMSRCGDSNELRITTAWILLISHSHPNATPGRTPQTAASLPVRSTYPNVLSNLRRPTFARLFLPSANCVSTIYFLSCWLSSITCHFEQMLAPRIFCLVSSIQH